MEGVNGVNSTDNEVKSDEPRFIYLKEAPRLNEILDHPIKRGEKIISKWYDAEWKTRERVFTEEIGLANLKWFLDQSASRLSEIGDDEAKDLVKRASSLKDNLVFIGKPEMQEAIHGMARHVVELIQNGNDVYVYIGGGRSEQYISILLMEEFDYLVEGKPELQEKLQFSDSARSIAKFCKDKESKVVAPDDFIISGNRSLGHRGSVVAALVENGIPQEKALLMVEELVVAAPIRKDEDRVAEKGGIFAYYGVSEVRDEDGKWMEFPGVSITGSHCSVDYGFEMVIDNISRKLGDAGTPILVNVKRPYEKVGFTEQYADRDLQKRWERVQRKYGLRNK